ncbi:MAG: sulfatase-like hydrolase/transferase [Candidatus Hydrogenedens sp.]|nr:sulfatase-like hydrolase/transferase [Candidatus Hydrogenedens sp.]
MYKKYLSYAVKLCIVVALFLLIFQPELFGLQGLFGDVAPMDVWNALRDASGTGPATFFFFMGCATLVKLLGILSGLIRWRLLLAGQGLKMPFVYMAYQWFMGRAIGLFLPGTLGLDGFRLVASSRYTREVVKCTTVIAVEKLTGIIALAFLVFITFPLGFKYLNINPVMLALIMLALLGGVVCSLLLLLNPRVIQVIAAVMPVPNAARGLINKLGRAATAYSNNRKTLLAALFFGVLVHLGSCTKYFFTFMAIRAAHVSAADIFFVSPLMITASVLAFTISGLGVREMAFGLVLGGSTGHAVAILGGHLGLWAGEILPFVLSVPLLLLGGRPNKEKLAEDRAFVEDKLAANREELRPLLTDEEKSRYQKLVFAMLFCGTAAGLLAGTVIALMEGAWVIYQLQALTEWYLLGWGAVSYGLIFAGLGCALAGGLLFLCLLIDRFPPWTVTTALVYTGVIALGGLVIGFFRYQRDVLGGHAPGVRDLVMLLTLVIGTALLLGIAAFIKSELFKRLLHLKAPGFIVVCVLSWLVLMGGAFAVAHLCAPDPGESPALAVDTPARGPNIILCAADALRADYLSLYDPEMTTQTPGLATLAEDGILFKRAFSQASWTKPSFATMFTGLYPGAHGATSKTALLSPEVVTLAGLLQEQGYMTQGFSNNPNTTALFGFDRGFTDYVDLKPDPLFSAPSSGMHLSLYGLMRKVFLTLEGKLRGGRLRVTDFYQPADVITDRALNWLDNRADTERSFYLYLHYMDTHDPFMDHSDPGKGYARARMEHPDPEKYLEPMRKAYISEIEFMDHHLGRLFEGLKSRGIYENTLIIFVSDHGEEFFDHEGWWHGQTLYEELLHVPLILKLPAAMEARGETETLARLVDLAPTMLEVAGLPACPEMSGQALVDRSGTLMNAKIQYCYAENDFEGNILQSLRTEDRALIQANEENPRGLQPVEFYDMNQDPTQQRNLAEDTKIGPEMNTLSEIIVQFMEAIAENAPTPSGEAAMDPQLQQQLEALGYL